MLDKSNRKHENTYRLNANSVDSSRTNSHGNEGHYLTDFTFNMIMEQLSLSKSCRAIRYDKNKFLVYTPEDENKKCRSLPPRFYRLRSINVIVDTYLHCACGFGSRNKMPCSYILSILQTYHSYMFGIRWLNFLQFGFERKGYEKRTSLFRKIEKKEFMRNTNIRESIFLNDMLSTNYHGDFPLCLDGSTLDDKECDATIEKRIG